MKTLNHILQKVKTESPILYGIVVMHAIFALASLIGIFVDDRELMGINIWIKPLKFCISGMFYILTVGYIIHFYPFSRRKRNIINNLVSWSLGIEIIIVMLQAFRGEQSHYNQTSLLNGILFALMGLFISIVVLTMFIFIVETIRLKMHTTRAIQWGVLLGWLVVFFSSYVGGQMIGQMAHNVGVADGGEGLPLLNWSTVAGDLRVAHFFGLHGIQIIPLFAWALTRKWQTKEGNRIALTILFGLLYFAWIGYTFYQAKQGMPLVKL
ncbi:hypothetical protein ABV409_08600 [Flagellimonas sp. DF-77]|uniref:hypothetical protein n=1 Tax=Flagellimonas algarum TaxID=3230298 RepID=UPI003394C680